VIGKQISHYYIVGLLGSGGMGDVFEAQDLNLPRSVALKFLKAPLLESAAAVKRFQREAWLAASLNHPNICTILELGACDGESFIAMELLQGESLKQRLRAGPLAFSEILQIANDVAHALVAAHGAGVVHRDLTPGNIFLTRNGGAKLLDFGLAKALGIGDDAAPSDTITAAETVIGTVHHLAPEQLQYKRADRRSDLFALGTVLYQAATGVRAFEARTKTGIIAQILTQQPLPLRRLAPHVPPEFEAVVAKLLEKNPADRYQRASELLKDLGTICHVDSAVVTRPVTRFGSTLSVAVLPFKILGDEDVTLRSFRDGLPADLAWWLQQAPGIRVVPQTSTEGLRGSSIKQIGEQLGAAAILEGSIQRAGPRLRVIANAIHAAREEPLRPPLRIEANAEDLLAAQDEVSRQIVAAVRAIAARSRVAGISDDPEVVFEYQRGLHYGRDLFRGGWHKVIEHASRARELDPNSPAVEILLSDTYSFLGMLSLMKPKVAFSKAETAAQRALTLAPDAAAAHAALALVRFGGAWDWDGAEAGFRRALELDPELSTARIYYSWLLAMQGRDSVAFSEADHAASLSRSRFVQAGAAVTYIMGLRYDEARRRIEECLKTDPSYLYGILVRGQCYHLLGDYATAHDDLLRAANLGHREPHYLGLLGKSYAEAGRHDDARAIIAELDGLASTKYVAPHCYMYVLYGLGERERALEFQEQAYRDGAPPINYFTPFIRHLFSLDPHHRDRLRQMRLNL
jgi:TolB-like protein/tRNA A-37 threonylcarbamoyl transferase component Bud32/Tfp pilus assembly protein PilF